MGNIKSPDSGKTKPRGFNLFAAVLDELVSKVEGDFSTEELMQAAQYLVALSKQDYVVKLEAERAARPNYYSLDVFDAFRWKQSQIMCFEQCPIDISDADECSIEVRDAIRRITLSHDELRWEV